MPNPSNTHPHHPPKNTEQKMKRLMEGDPELIEEAAANLANAFASAGAEVGTLVCICVVWVLGG